MDKLDPRLHAYRPDLADEALRGQVEASRFVRGSLKRIVAPVAALYKIPDTLSERQSECLFGEDVKVFEEKNGFCWVQAQQDGYVGYIEQSKIGSIGNHPTHRVNVPRTFQYRDADLRSPMISPLSMGSRISVVSEAETRDTHYARLDNGSFVVFNHITPVSTVEDDYVTIAESFIHTPYLWGGKSGLGIDCSGLVQLALMMTGRTVLRDTDMQQATIGKDIAPENGLQRGDLVFWKGHVAIMVDSGTLIHANGASMDVRKENLDHAIERIAKNHSTPTGYRRL
ncbi:MULTISPECIES: NlpC/P60 family protein [Bartonella]|uniref:C40 family peptidase n=1 Tax=Bartonella TaxID=773 RepID=UPI0018DBFB9A|nr:MULTISPECIES: NlpC/P60 family protein [Bartonella]MBH9995421.1 C40 family peptidase [Bartonella sp. P0291]MBH9996235.1 C40 family peptidase [Bartonella sp. M0192]MBH9998396.1 C40 family peptidase [Bartonella sp. M0191]MBI0007689.1 C40 family peptidase [Bartonella sp. M0193]MBI0009686.1 C40 family peptidase [Bartonella sp. M0176]